MNDAFIVARIASGWVLFSLGEGLGMRLEEAEKRKSKKCYTLNYIGVTENVFVFYVAMWLCNCSAIDVAGLPATTAL